MESSGKHNFYQLYAIIQEIISSLLASNAMGAAEVDLNKYDLIISSESGPAKGVVKNPKAKHICYCHSPMRYIWDQQSIYLEQSGIFKR